MFIGALLLRAALIELEFCREDGFLLPIHQDFHPKLSMPPEDMTCEGVSPEQMKDLVRMSKSDMAVLVDALLNCDEAQRIDAERKTWKGV